MLYALTYDEALALEGVAAEGRHGGPGARGEEDLREPRSDGPGSIARGGELDWHLSPSENLESFLPRELGNELDGPLSSLRLLGEERHPGAVAPRLREIDPCDLRIEAVRHLHQRPRAVAGSGVGPERTPVSEVLEGGQPERDDAVAGGTLQIHNERDPA